MKNFTIREMSVYVNRASGCLATVTEYNPFAYYGVLYTEQRYDEYDGQTKPYVDLVSVDEFRKLYEPYQTAHQIDINKALITSKDSLDWSNRMIKHWAEKLDESTFEIDPHNDLLVLEEIEKNLTLIQQAVNEHRLTLNMIIESEGN